MATRNFRGATVNGSGTRIATIKAIGTGIKDTAKEVFDTGSVVKVSSMEIPVKAAINMGLLNRNASGALEELNPPSTPTRVG